MGSQHSNRAKGRKKSKGRSSSASSGGGEAGGGGGTSQEKSEIEELLENKEFKFAASVAIGTAMKVTGTDTMAAVAIASAKGYQDYKKQGAASGVATATKEFAKGQIVGAVAGAVTSSAVGYAKITNNLKLSSQGTRIVTDAVASALEQI